MTSDRHATDEPDGTPALAASMRPPGDSVTTPGADDGDGDGDGDDGFDDPRTPAEPGAAFDGPVLPGESRAGYDVDDVSGDTDAVRPQ